MNHQIAIAGGSGFIGRSLLAALPKTHKVVALSRHPAESLPANKDHITWQSCDLFNLRQTEQALQNCGVAYYLVHSMLPQARLAQGNFADTDLICADNFARAAKLCGVQHIIYLSGLIPPQQPLSEHLQSRLEVEQTLGAHGVPLTTLRAGLVVGALGSSYQMLIRLAKRLPVMLTPSWTQSLTQPIALADVIDLLLYVLEHPEVAGRNYDIGGPDILSYAALLRQAGALLGREPRIYTVPINPMRLSLLWVSLITQTPRQLVMPLIESLRHDMVAQDGLILQQKANLQAMSLIHAMRLANQHLGAYPHKRSPTYTRRPPASSVLSVQRLSLPKNQDAIFVAQEYMRWLPKKLWPFLKIKISDSFVYQFYLRFLPEQIGSLLDLSYIEKRSSRTRQLFYITGGWLCHKPSSAVGRFEFRCVLNQRFILTAVHDYMPSLPWYIYVNLQAILHKFIMRSFGRHLQKLSKF